MKIYEFAREYNVLLADVLNYLRSNGTDVKGPTSNIPDNMLEDIKTQFSSPSADNKEVTQTDTLNETDKSHIQEAISLFGQSNYDQKIKGAEIFAAYLNQGAFIKYAEQDTTCSFYLGVMYDIPFVVKKDDEKASYWYNISASLGLPSAQFNLGSHYMSGRGVTKNPQKAFELYLQAAGNGHSRAMFKVAQCYDRGLGTDKNEEQALLWYRRAIDAGQKDADTYCYIAYLLAEGSDAVKNEEEAVKYYLLAIEEDSTAACNNLGVMYKDGRGIKQDVGKAVKYFELASKKGNAFAQFNLAKLYEKGDFVPLDLDKALTLFKEAAANNHPAAKDKVIEIEKKIEVVKKQSPLSQNYRSDNSSKKTDDSASIPKSEETPAEIKTQNKTSKKGESNIQQEQIQQQSSILASTYTLSGTAHDQTGSFSGYVNEFVYGRYEKEDNNYYYFKFANDRTWRNRKDIIEKAHPGYGRTGIWFAKCSSDGEEDKYFPNHSALRNLGIQASVFFNNHSIHDVIRRPVIEKTNTGLKVGLGPTFYTFVPRSSVIDVNYDTIKEGSVQGFVIENMERDQQRHIVSLRIINIGGHIELSRQLQYYDQIPANLSGIQIPDSILKTINNDPNLEKALKQALGEINRETLRQRINTSYNVQKKKHSLIITAGDDQQPVRIDIYLDIKDSNGVPIYVGLNHKSEYNTYNINFIGLISGVGKIMETMIFVPNWSQALKELRNLALEEKWGFRKGTSSVSFLKSYLSYTYYKAWLDGLIVENENGLIFNTGLVDELYDDIYCLCSINTDPADSLCRPYKLDGFACVGRDMGKYINRSFALFPPAPNYIRKDHLEDLFFDTTRNFPEPDYIHMIIEHFERLPRNLLKEVLNYDPVIVSMIDSEAPDDELKEYICNDMAKIRNIRDRIRSGVIFTIKQCKWNYKIAVPMYYARKNRVSLLLPLYLTGDRKHADIALVVSLLDNGNYQGETIYTMEMAYKDARQICRPTSEWLQVSEIKDSLENH